jgi:hypothetical protein
LNPRTTALQRLGVEIDCSRRRAVARQAGVMENLVS